MMRVVARRVFLRHLTNKAVPRADVLRAVQGIVQEKAACPPAEAETASLAGDLALKFKVLSACERHFQIAIPHAALVDMVDAGSVAAYVESALRANEAAEAQAAQHWSKALPSNVSMVGFTAKHQGRNERLPELLVTPHGDAKFWNPARQAERE